MQLPSIRLADEDLAHFDDAILKEWIITNGLGGYAASTVLGLNTRKYHGLLVAALHPPGNRTVCLAKLDEDIQMGDTVQQLGVNEFQDTIYPRGYMFLKQFSLSPFPTYTYVAQGIKVEKTIFMPKEKNVVVVIYSAINNSGSDAEFRIYPLLTCRHFHSVINKRTTALSFSQQLGSNEFTILFDMPKAAVAARATMGKFVARPTWIHELYYREETNRGESNIDDCYQPGYFTLEIMNGVRAEFAIVTAASEDKHECTAMLDTIGKSVSHVKAQFEMEISRRERLLANFYSQHCQAAASDWLNWLLLAADAFVVKGSCGRTWILAGYFWFETWGRDTFISMPGLLLVLSKFEEARSILLNFMAYSKHGLIPNYIADRSGEAFYNTVDATLWYVHSVLQFLKYTGDFNFVRKHLWNGLKKILDYHEHGTDFGIHLDRDGLLAHGPRLTWMDAEIDGEAVTPRAGKAVEIQALWYNALRVMQLLSKRFEEQDLAEKYSQMAHAAKKSFNEKFWNIKNDCLFDVISESGAHSSLRPNQIIAVALDFVMLEADRCRRVVDAVRRELLTPFGLRTIARNDPKYMGRYVGDRKNRDQAYHNGTVWPWLLGPYITAACKAKSYSASELQALLMPLFNQQINQAGLGTLSEIFDGDPPHTPRGCIAQAWSVAEPLRALMEDALQIRPKYEQALLRL